MALQYCLDASQAEGDRFDPYEGRQQSFLNKDAKSSAKTIQQSAFGIKI